MKAEAYGTSGQAGENALPDVSDEQWNDWHWQVSSYFRC